MKIISPGIIFSLRTFAAMTLALYVSYCLDLQRPVWSFLTVYIVSGPLLGMGRSKSLYRLCGTFCGAVFTVIALPNLVNTPELLVLALSLWIGFCLYLSIIDGTPRGYGFMLAGYTTAVIGFPSVSNPQNIFDTALSRTEEISVALLCVQLMSYLPFNQRAGSVLLARIDKWLLDTRAWAVDLMRFSNEDIIIADRSKLMIDAAALEALRVQARFETIRFRDSEQWIVLLQRYLQDFFSNLVTFEAQIKTLKATNPDALPKLQPFINAILTWIKEGGTEIPGDLQYHLKSAETDARMHELIRTGIHETLCNLVLRRSECLKLRAKLAEGAKASETRYEPITKHIDHTQAIIYGLGVAGVLSLISSFWILAAWTDGGTAALLSTVLCCFFSSLEAPPKATFSFLILAIFGASIGLVCNFVIFPHIDGFVLMIYVLGMACIPIGIGMATPALAPLMLPIILGISLASFQNRFDANIADYLNGVVALVVACVATGTALNLIRILSLRGAVQRLLTENGRSLAALAKSDRAQESGVIDRMAHRAGLAFSRAPGLKEERNSVITRILLDLQTGHALQHIKALIPGMAPELQNSMHTIQDKVAVHFFGRRGLHESVPVVCEDIRTLANTIASNTSYNAMRLTGFLRTLSRGLGKEVV